MATTTSGAAPEPSSSSALSWALPAVEGPRGRPPDDGREAGLGRGGADDEPERRDRGEERDHRAHPGTGGATAIVEAADDLARRARLARAGSDQPGAADAHGLTPRELEVLALVAAGRTNKAIGEELFISARTASVHVSNLLRKLGASNRGGAAALARDLGLLTDTRSD